MHLSIETPTPPPPPRGYVGLCGAMWGYVGLCGAMWGTFMVFEVMVSPWGWGISQDLLSIFIRQSAVGGVLRKLRPSKTKT